MAGYQFNKVGLSSRIIFCRNKRQQGLGGRPVGLRDVVQDGPVGRLQLPRADESREARNEGQKFSSTRTLEQRGRDGRKSR